MATTEPRWSRLEHDERRAQILATARRLFSERPFSAVSTTEIAQAAGIARGLLHHYFGTKRDLYLEVVKDLVRVPDMDVGQPPADVPPRHLWEASVDIWLDFIEANKDMWLVAIDAGETGRDERLHAILDEAREATARRVLMALGLAGDDEPPEVRALVRGYGAMAEEVSREWLDRGRLTKEQARVLLRGAMPLLVDHVLPALVEARGAEPRSWRGLRELADASS